MKTEKTETRTVLISGASVAGLSQAYWMKHNGFEPTIVEKHPTLRPGGQAIDVRGTALEVLDRMAILEKVRAAKTGIRGMTLVDGEGNELYSSTEATFTGGTIDNDDVEILRDDLCEFLYEVTKDDVEFVFGDSIGSMEEVGDAVRVTFDSGAVRDFDIVVGADGLHSNVRRLAFGPEQPYARHLGMYMGVFTAPNFLDLDYWQIFQQPDDMRGGGIMSARDNTEARVYLGFKSEPIEYDYRDLDAQRKVFAQGMEGVGWEVPRMLEYMWDAPDFHFDAVSQIHLDTWSKGRVILVGDAAHCGSLLSGQGTSTALVDGFVLAQELARAGGDHEVAFEAYETRLRPWISQNQELAIANSARREAELAGRDPSEVEGPEMEELKSAFAL